MGEAVEKSAQDSLKAVRERLISERRTVATNIMTLQARDVGLAAAIQFVEDELGELERAAKRSENGKNG